ncbi:undecaprenyl/decaprenyl-phosphate alpha-N-acetylglucosaminyl 1-phosphate transferase [Granulosicoccus sp.]|nr:MraY family glycosyltransferase [Granulosicoccus sp.]MDB4222412.1 undecaprenyl/decaprenyl-phosphate alpha-N-acetylglucosaminyl 1-phosphate transferase [Granulosicoccus sp.]
MEIYYAAGIPLIAFLYSLALVPIARTFAINIGLVDAPSIRKRHVGHVPLAGGIVITTGLWCALPFLPKSETIWATTVLSVPLFLLGAIDDRYQLSAHARLLAQLSAGVALVFVFGISITQLDGVYNSTPLILAPVMAAMFTVLCTCGVLNAINMADGIDGLLGSVSSISLCAIAIVALNGNALPEAALALLMVGLLAGYLAFNLGFFGPGRRIFLGDSGSMVVGLVLFILLVELSQKTNPVITSTSAGWILGLPLLDTVSVMVRRVVQGRSAFTAGRDHFHHVLQDLGLSRKSTLKVLIVLQLLFVAIGLIANNTELPQFYFFWGFVAITLIQYFGISCAVKYIANGRISEDGIEKSIAVEEC